jgi:uncharacterized protein YhaN
MRLDALDLIAYGPFTTRRLEFPAPLTIVYGPNEAGKSSALRALVDALYGIPGQTPDAFLHPYASLRIGIELSNGRGRLGFIRRKGRLQTLRAPDDSTVVEDSTLERELDGLGRDAFVTMFGISHEALVEGGRALAEGKGEVGELLFVSAAGLSGMQATLARLDQQASDLYTPRASSKSIHRWLRELREAEQSLKDKQVAIARFQENRKALEEIEGKLAALDGEIETARRESERLSRIRGALPTISERKQCVLELTATARAVPLPEDYGERLQKVESRLRETRQNEAQYGHELARVTDAIAAFQVRRDLIEAEERIRALFERRSVIQKSKEDCIRRTAELATVKRDALDKVQRLRPGMTLEQAAGLEPGLMARNRVQQLAPVAVRLEADRDALNRGLAEARRKLDEHEVELAGLPPAPDVTELAAAAERARRALDPRRARDLRLKIAAAEKTIAPALGSLAPWNGTADDLEALPVPPPEAIEEFREAMQSAAAEERGAREKLSEAERQLNQAEADRRRLVALEEVPTVAELADARELRDSGWSAVKRLWKTGDNAGELQFLARTAHSDLATAYERTVADADGMADHMREHARQVEQLAALDAEIEVRQRRSDEARKSTASAGQATAAVAERWTAAWAACGIVPQTPAAMLAWLRRRREILQQVQAMRELRLELQALEDAEATHAAELARLLSAHGGAAAGSAADILAEAESVVTAAAKARDMRRDLTASQELERREIARLQGEIAGIAGRSEEWQRQWSMALEGAGLPELSPGAAELYLNCVREIDADLKKAADLEHRITTMRADAGRFTAEVSEVVAHLSPEHIGLEPEAAIGHLHRSLTEAHQNLKLLEQKRSQQSEIEVKWETAKQSAARCAAELDGLCREASAPDGDTARQAWAVSSRRRELEKRVAEYDERLRLVSAGKTVDEFLADAAAVDADSIAGSLEEINNAIASRRQKRSQLGKQRDDLNAAGGAMRGGDEAASAAQHISGLAGRLADDVEEYVRLRTATFVIRKAIERYRERNQGPVLERASRLFAEFTRGSFASLRVESEEGAAILVGIRRNGEVVPLPGMSDGTLDQLYLALRIASLEHYSAAREPAPFIVDDVLLNFDDERAAAALSALDALSEKTQVIFFTHHKRLVEIAAQSTKAKICEL